MIEQIKQAIDRAIPAIAIELRTALKISSPVDTARLRSSIDVVSSGNKLIVTMVDYGKFIEFGTLPHIIRPKNKKALSWKGAAHPVKMVRHPGTRPNPFIRTTVRRKLPHIIMRNIGRELK